jgi:hypothetical protein
MVVIAVITRLIPHTFNFTAMGAVSMFGAAYFSSRRLAIFTPLLAVWVSDLYLNNVMYDEYFPEFTWFYEGFYWQYGTYTIITLLGFMLFRKITVIRVVIGALSSSVIFFLITNFGSWIGSTFYSQNLTGLMASYTAGLPFFRATLVGDLIFTSAMFGLYEFFKSIIPSREVSKA